MINIYYTHLEDFIFNLYKALSIETSGQLDIMRIAKKLNLNIYYGRKSLRFRNNIFLPMILTKQQKWQKFGHEVCHYFWHSGNQLNMFYMFRDLQEFEANRFAYHFCVPTFMLEKLKGLNIYEIMDVFNVEYDFALRRLEMYENKKYTRGISS